MEWIGQTQFPKYLNSGAGQVQPMSVWLKARYRAKKLINKAFGSGFSQYEAFSNLNERHAQMEMGKGSLQRCSKRFCTISFILPNIQG
jgi:hypothetical protein